MSIIATAGETLNLFDYRANQFQKINDTFPESPSELKYNAVNWNHNNKAIATCGSDGYLSIFNSGGNSVICKFNIGDGPLRTLCFNNRSRYLLCGGNSKNVHLIDIKLYQTTGFLTGHNSSIFSLLCLPTGNLAVSGSDSLLIHNIKTKEIIKTFPSNNIFPSSITSLDMHKDSPHLLACGNSNGEAKLIDLEVDSGEMSLVESLNSKDSSGNETIERVRFDPRNANVLATAWKEGKILFYDIRERNTAVQKTTCGTKLAGISFEESGQVLGAAGKEGNVFIVERRKMRTNYFSHGIDIGENLSDIDWQQPYKKSDNNLAANVKNEEKLADVTEQSEENECEGVNIGDEAAERMIEDFGSLGLKEVTFPNSHQFPVASINPISLVIQNNLRKIEENERSLREQKNEIVIPESLQIPENFNEDESSSLLMGIGKESNVALWEMMDKRFEKVFSDIIQRIQNETIEIMRSD